MTKNYNLREFDIKSYTHYKFAGMDQYWRSWSQKDKSEKSYIDIFINYIRYAASGGVKPLYNNFNKINRY